MLQTTIKKRVYCSGIGLHSGKLVQLTLLPGAENSGVVFHIHTKTGVSVLRPNPQAVIATGLATTLGMAEASVATVEHLMAAIRGLEIDNIIIEIKGGEVPIMDGSAASFVLLLKSAGMRRQKSPRNYARIIRPISIEDGEKWIKATPYNGFKINYTIDFAHPAIGVQNMEIELTPETFVNTLAKARTFGFLKEVEYLNKNGLALGGSLDNAIVLDEYSVINEDGLRFEDEFVRHKILDFVGDMAMMGLPILGSFDVHCSGHGLNNAFLRRLNENKELYLATDQMHTAVEHKNPIEDEALHEMPGLLGAAG